MSQAFVRESSGPPLIRSSKESAENAAEVYRGIEPGYDFEVRAGRGGFMVARLNKDKTFDSWVEE